MNRAWVVFPRLARKPTLVGLVSGEWAAASNRITSIMRMKRVISGLILVALAGGWSSAQSTDGKGAEAAKGVPGSEACAGCHAEIYKSYSKTVMANASGPASEGLITGEFFHKPSGVRYRVYEEDGSSHASLRRSGSENRMPTSKPHTVWMSYERAAEGFRGQRELIYFIGSGRKGRSYLFSDDGFWFETPINWYSQEGRWNMAPAYTESREIPMNLPSFADCLNCHTSGMQAPVAGTDNKYAGQPFAHPGITCERCHGVGEGHLEGKGQGERS